MGAGKLYRCHHAQSDYLRVRKVEYISDDFWLGGNIMKKTLYIIIATVLFAPYICAYGIAHLLKVADREDMPTPKEWFGLEKEVVL